MPQLLLLLLITSVASAQDADLDGVDDAVDSCPSVANPTQSATFGAARLLDPVGIATISQVDFADMDGDGRDDLVVEGGGALVGNHVVWLQQPDGTFESLLSRINDNGDGEGSAVGDLDGDGDPDVVASSNLHPYLNAGDGTLVSSGDLVYLNDFGVTAVLAVDLDSDGDGDLVYAANEVVQLYGPPQEYRWIMVKESLGGGVFGPEDFVDGDWGYGVPDFAAGDVDGDGDPDVAFTDPVLGDVRWLENTGGTTLVPQSLPSPASFPGAPALADIDGDGADDLALVSCADDSVAWISAVATAPVAHVLPDVLECPTDATLRDLDADGDPDLVVSWSAGVGWFENVAGVFTGLQELASVPSASAVATGDLDSNGTPDVAYGTSTSGQPGWIPNFSPADVDLDGTCDTDDACPLDPAVPCIDADGDRLSDSDEGLYGTDPLLADTDGDGLGDYEELVIGLDPLLSDSDGDGIGDLDDPCPGVEDPDLDGVCGSHDLCPLDADPDQVDLDGDGFGAACDSCDSWPVEGVAWAAPSSIGGQWVYSTVADLDGDGVSDLVVADYYSLVGWMRGTGDGAFEPARVTSGGGVPAAADLDGDGDVDVVLIQAGTDLVLRSENLGAGVLAPAALVTVLDSPSGILPFDLGADGDMDLLVTTLYDEILYAIENLGGAVFAAPVVVNQGVGLYGETAPRSTDIDGDGDLDLLTGSSFADGINLYLNVAGVLSKRIDVYSADGMKTVDAADIDGDGDVDIVAASTTAHQVIWLENDGALGFGNVHVAGTALDEAFLVATLDMDRDGDADIVGNTGFYNEDFWLENDGAGNFVERTISGLGRVDLVMAAVVDLDGDHDLEVVGSGVGGAWIYTNITAPDLDGDGVCDVIPADGDGDGWDASADCDDGDPERNPGMIDVCNGVDDDCSLVVDDGDGVASHPDADGDGYGDALLVVVTCVVAPGWTEDGGDCDDGAASVHPGGVDVCNGMDDDCDGSVDGGSKLKLWHPDADLDGFGDEHSGLPFCAKADAPPRLGARRQGL